MDKKIKKLNEFELINLVKRVKNIENKLFDTWDLSKAEINYLPTEVINLIKDETCRLALSYNKLSELPIEILQLSKLRYLNLRANSFTQFPLIVKFILYLHSYFN